MKKSKIGIGENRHMIKELVHDPIFPAGKSEDATKEDLRVAQDLLDTQMAHRSFSMKWIIVMGF